ncbi:MAG: polysaccharide deacetylase family protein [Clostridiales Family XIII bacterium]|jgi:peptidoglycan/xylan/chitin deacetylase (PgdA/CDA1 family)|nr:polysaccharide deacetylase family protein [Clostridiales Family XIII bacterium]
MHHHRHIASRLLLAVLITILLAAMPGCTPKAGVVEEPVADPTESLAPDEGFDMEYGTPDVLIDNSEPLFAYIRYPKTGIHSVDKVILDWAKGVYRDAQAEADRSAADKDADKAQGEVNIQCRSWLLGGRYAGIEERGTLHDSYLAHPVDIVRTFNVDVRDGRLLSLSDIIDPDSTDEVLDLLRDQLVDSVPDVEEVLDEPEESWLTNIILTHEGLDVVLERGLCLPTYLGTQAVTLAYEDLGDALRIDVQAALDGEGDAGTGEPTEIPDEEGPEASGPPNGQEKTDDADEANPPGKTDEDEADGAGQGTKPGSKPNSKPTGGSEADPDSPMLALTFDDGPGKHTNAILDLLKKHDAKATFCVLGNLVNGRKGTVRRAADLGCEIIGHSWDHKQLTKLTKEEIKAEINDTSDEIARVCGQRSNLYRPPYGAVDDKVRKISKQLGFSMLGWSVDTLDWKTKNADAVYNAVMKGAKDGAIILLHDIHGSTADAMKRVIPKLIEKGFQLVTVSELLESKGVKTSPGETVHNG